jgi:TolA-binding protein
LKKSFMIALLCVALLPATTYSQKKRTSAKRSSRAATISTAQKNADAVREGATQLADQIKNLTRFIYVLGGVAKGLEQADGAIRRKEASATIIASTEESKAKVRATLQDVRAGLDKLEIDFRATPALTAYYYKLAGVADGAAKSEQLAAANQFDQAGRTLLSVVNRLTDVLLDMR